MSKAANNPNDSLRNSDYMSPVKTHIEKSSNYPVTNFLYELKSTDSAKLELNSYKNRDITLVQIQAILFDKTIFALLNEQKFSNNDYRLLFYIFFNRNDYFKYKVKCGHLSFEKYFKKYFNACIDHKKEGGIIFSNFDIAEFINLYIYELFKAMTKEKIKEINSANDIKNLSVDKITNLGKFDEINLKFIRNLIKYILAFCNILQYSKYYDNYHNIIFEKFNEIKDITFHAYFMKQVYKIFINKGIYKHGNELIMNLFYPIIHQNKKISPIDLKPKNFQGFPLINIMLSYIPKFYKNEKNINFDYANGSPYYFLNFIVLMKTMDDLLLNENIKEKLLFKFANAFNSFINLFIDDGSQLKVAELILTDTVNDKIILRNFERMKLIKPFIQNMDNLNNNGQYWQYFEYLFYDLGSDIYLLHYYENKNSAKNIILNQNNTIIYSQSLSQDLNSNSFIINNNFKNNVFNYEKILINKFMSSNDIFIQKYFNINFEDTIEEENIEDILKQKNLESLFILLDIIYNVSIKFKDDNLIKKSIKDVQKIIKQIIIKSYEENKFNCTIFNFILLVDEKYIPSSNDFDIILSNVNILLNNSYKEFINTYPSYIIFIINYFPKYNYDITKFFEIIKSFIEGYASNVFAYLDKNPKGGHDHTLQINYLNLIYFILRQMINIHLGKITDEDIYKNLKLHLPYCIKCKKKLYNYLIHSKYLSQCFYCAEKFLYINTNDLYSYLIQGKKHVEKFVEENFFKIITDITHDILFKFKEKDDNKNKVSLFGYSLYYKIIQEHFQFLNYIQFIIGQNIPFVEDTNILNKLCNNKEATFEKIFENLFKEFENKNKYPFKDIYDSINNNIFMSFNTYRKTIKHERAIVMNRYIKK